MDGLIGYVLAKGYVNNTVKGMGALKGSACQIKSITPIVDGNQVIFTWTDNTGMVYMSDPMIVKDGKSASKTWCDVNNYSSNPSDSNYKSEEDFLNAIGGVALEDINKEIQNNAKNGKYNTTMTIEEALNDLYVKLAAVGGSTDSITDNELTDLFG